MEKVVYLQKRVNQLFLCCCDLSLGCPGQRKLLFSEKSNPMCHSSRKGEHFPHNICLFYQIWEESIGKKLTSFSTSEKSIAISQSLVNAWGTHYSYS